MGFTLAEVLITLVIIGIVAAMTIPSLMVKLDKVVKDNQIKVFESKLQQGMDAMNLAGEIGPYYNTTEEFVKKLSEHMKIVTICDKNNLTNCFPYKEIQTKDNKFVRLTDIKSGGNFGLDKNNYKDVAGLVLADGTPMILSWNINCPVSDPDSSTRKSSIIGDETAVITTACVKGIYDLNGSKGPNLFTKDIVSYGGVSFGNDGFTGALAWLNGARVLPAGSWQPMTIQEICGESIAANTWCTASTAEAAALGIKTGFYENDYWAGAVRECGGMDKMPTMTNLASLANAIYKTTNGDPVNIGETDSIFNGIIYQPNSDVEEFLTNANLTYYFTIWSRIPNGNANIFGQGRSFGLNQTNSYCGNRCDRNMSNITAICLSGE